MWRYAASVFMPLARRRHVVFGANRLTDRLVASGMNGILNEAAPP